MSFSRMQPTFFVTLDRSAQDATQFIRRSIEQMGLNNVTKSVGNCVEFFVQRKQQRLWSPHLSIQIHDQDEGAQLVGRFSPRPEIWTLVMFLYAAMLFVIFAGAMLGWSQWIAKEPTWGFWFIPVAMVVLLTLHTISWIGQQWSRDQMELLRDQLKNILGEMQLSEWKTRS